MVYQESETITLPCRLESCGVFPVCTAVQGRPCYLSMSMRAKGVTACSITRVEGLLVIPRPVWVPSLAHFCTILSLKDIRLVIFISLFTLLHSRVSGVCAHASVQAGAWVWTWCVLVRTYVVARGWGHVSSLIALSGLASPSRLLGSGISCLWPEGRLQEGHCAQQTFMWLPGI